MLAKLTAAIFFTLVTAVASAQPVVFGTMSGTPPGCTGDTCQGPLVVATDAVTNQVISSLEIPYGTHVGTMVLSPDGSKLYVTMGPDPFIGIIDLATFTLVDRMLAGVLPFDVAISADGSRLFAANFGSNTLSIIDTVNRIPVAAVPVGSGPVDVELTPNGAVALVLASSSRDLTFVDTATHAVLGTLVITDQPSALAISADGARAYVVHAAPRVITVVDIASRSVVATGSLPLNGTGVAFAAGKLWVTHFGTLTDGGVSRVDPATLAVEQTVSVARAKPVAVSPDGTRLYVGADASIVAIDTASNAIVSTTFMPRQTEVWDVTVLPAGACNASTTAGELIFDASGGARSLPVTVDPGCPWSISTAAPWLHVAPANNGVGPATLSVTADPGNTPRVGTLRLGFRTVPVEQVIGHIAIDTPGEAPVLQPFDLSGWAIERRVGALASTGIDVIHVWDYGDGTAPPVFLGAATYGAFRLDILTLFGGPYGASGFNLRVSGLSVGVHRLVVFARSIRTGTFNNVAVRTVTVTDNLTMGGIDSLHDGDVVRRPFLVGGWALDRAAATGPGVDAVHVWAYPLNGSTPLLVGVASYGTVTHARYDIAGVLGLTRIDQVYSGFTAIASTLPDGGYQIVAFAHSTVNGAFKAIGVVTVTVAGDGPTIFINRNPSSFRSGQHFQVYGIAFDERDPAGVGVSDVHLWAYPISGGSPTFLGARAPFMPRDDIAALYGSSKHLSGFWIGGVPMPLPPGQYDFVYFARSTVSGLFDRVAIKRYSITP